MRQTVAHLLITALVLFASSGCAAFGASAEKAGGKTPVIFDTDIGGDIDDTWALALLLQSPELDVKLVTTEVGDTRSKAKTVAKLLETVGRTDIPVGVGLRQHERGNRQEEWAKGYDLSSYPGTVHEDGVKAMIETIMDSPRTIRVVAVGPVPNVAEALEREPGIAGRAEFVGMHGSVRRGYNGSPEPDAEYNVRADADAAQKVLSALWEKTTITPLDTCGIVHLGGERYQRVLQNDSALTNALIENYRAWYRRGVRNSSQDLSADQVEKRVERKVGSSSTTLFDTVAIYLAVSQDLVKMEELPITVTDDGYTRIDRRDGTPILCATEWKDLDAYNDWLVRRLTK